MKISVKIIGLILGPLFFVIISLLNFAGSLGPEAWKVLGIATWMVIWWVTEATPMAVVALLPIVIFPATGIFTMTEATAPYANPVIFLFMGGFFIALGLEEHGLHRRLALNLVKFTGTGANGIILGFMLATGFLSMWISNTAATIMMLPLASTVINIIGKNADDKKGLSLFSIALMLGIAYSANVGGISTIIGTPPNVVFTGYAKELLNTQIDFSSWLIVGFPISAILLFLTFFLLTQVLYRSRLGRMTYASKMIDSELKSLGRMSSEEKLVAFVFGLTAFMWIFKLPINKLLGKEILNDTATAIIGGILIFTIPRDFRKGIGLVPWEATRRLPWGILLLFGGGLTLAKAMETTGVIDVIANLVAGNRMSAMFVYLIMIGSMLLLTELMSNVALATMYIPVAIGIASGLGMDPLLLSMPMAMASSCAFMMPISTPPNAIVFSSGHIQINQMLYTGLILNIISVAILLAASFTIIRWVFG
jgi:sodium-dependent dicarboxylate transporter 2/3/5